jgi:hypothetical protein
MWDGLDILDYNDDVSDSNLDNFFNFRDSYIEENDMDLDLLALSFIKSGEYDEFLDSST